MSVRYSFRLQSADARREFPHKLLLARDREEPLRVVLLRLLAYLLFFRERLEVCPRLQDEDIRYRPDLVQLDYQLRPVLWVECGGNDVQRVHRLAVKVPDAKIWLLQSSPEEAVDLVQAMTRAGLRRGRYRIMALDAVMMDEMLGLLESRNQVFWVTGTFEPPLLQFEFNGLWFDHEFTVHEF